MMDADLVLEGGGTKGVALAGAVARILEDYRVQRVAGTSVGAMVAAFVAAGWPAERLRQETLELPLREIPEASTLDRIWVLGPILSWTFTRGVFSTDFVHDYVARKLAEDGIETFGDLRMEDSATSLPPEKRYKLVVTTTDLTTGELLYLPWDYPKMGLDPDEQPVADAVTASLAIPLYFEPRRLTAADGTDHVLVDGGLLSNFPIAVFDRTDGQPPRWPTFGVKIIPTLPADARKLIPWFGRVPHPGLRHAEAVLATAIIGRDQTAMSRPGVRERVLQVDTSDVGLIEFRMSRPARVRAFQMGHEAATSFLDSWDWQSYLEHCRPEVRLERLERGLIDSPNEALVTS